MSDRDLPQEQLDAFADRLRSNLVNTSIKDWHDLKMEVEKSHKDAISSKAGAVANRWWFLRRVTTTRLKYVESFEKIRNGQYYEAWRTLEEIEIAIISLKRNPFFDLELFSIGTLASLVACWQSIYPYRLFFSPEYISEEVRCSICDSPMDPWSNCPHKTGLVYDGEEAVRIVSKAQFLSISLVTNPVQKYSVAFMAGSESGTKDHHDYSVVKFVADRLRSPFDRWSGEWEQAYHPHEIFQARPSDGCPCGSGRLYRDCCSKKPGVLRPHLVIDFEQDPPASMPNAQLAGYGELSRPAKLK